MLLILSGNYGPEITLEKLKDFHRHRLQVLVEARPVLLAFETVPKKIEAQVHFLHFQNPMENFVTFPCMETMFSNKIITKIAVILS